MTQGDPQQQDPFVGSTIAGKYRIVQLLGEGGMGCVYVGEQQMGTTVRKVAVKTLHKHLSQDPHIKARFQREVGTVAGLEHPNTIQVFDFGTTDDGTLYIVMELVQGRSVADILEKEGAMPPPRVENILRQVCGSLEEAHGLGIVHRDLKPDNVVLCERAGQKDWVEVLDFGIAKRSSEHDPNEAKLTQQGMVLGTPPYMSPEQFTGQPVDARSDIYALGVMAYEMLTGRLPFEANTAWEWASKHMTEAPTPLEVQANGASLPPAMRSAIMRALAKNKDERFSSVKEFFQAFSAGAAPVGVATAMDAAPPTSSAGRAKTEMAQPVMGAPPGAMTPPYGGPASPGPGAGFGAPASVPNAPAPAQKKGGAGLIIALGVVAVLLLGGGAIAYLSAGGDKTADPVNLADLATSNTAVNANGTVEQLDAAVATATPAETVTAVAPLESPKIPEPQHQATTTKPATKHTAKIPTPKPDPPECAAYRRKAKNPKTNAAVLAVLKSKCVQAGGTP